MKCKSALIVCGFCLYAVQALAADIEVPLFMSVEEKIQKSQEEQASSSRSRRTARRTPNIGKGAKPAEEIKIAPDPFPAIRIKSAEPQQEIGAPFNNQPLALETASTQTPAEVSVPDVSFQPAYPTQDIQIVAKKADEPVVEEKKETPAPKREPRAAREPAASQKQEKQQTAAPASNVVVVPKPGMPTTIGQALPSVQAPHLAENFDIMGMKLHMTPEEIISIAQDNGFTVSNVAYAIPLFMTTAYEQQCRQGGFAQLRLIHDCVRTQAQADDVYYISELRLDNAMTKEQIVVSFVSGLTENQASRIDYTSFGDNSLGTSYKDAAKKTARRDLFWKLVFDKYGQPNFPKMLLWGDPRKIYMQAFMEGSALNGRLILDDKELPYQDMEAAGKINDAKEVPHTFSFVKDTQEMY